MSIPIECIIRYIGGPADGAEETILHENLTHQILIRNISKDYRYRFKELTPTGTYLYYYEGT